MPRGPNLNMDFDFPVFSNSCFFVFFNFRVFLILKKYIKKKKKKKKKNAQHKNMPEQIHEKTNS